MGVVTVDFCDCCDVVMVMLGLARELLVREASQSGGLAGREQLEHGELAVFFVFFYFPQYTPRVICRKMRQLSTW